MAAVYPVSKQLLLITQTLVVQIAAYSTGDLAGGKITLPYPIDVPKFAAGGLIQSVVITDLAKQSVSKDVLFFSADPSGTTFTENAALDVADTDLPNLIGVAQVTNWITLAGNSFGQADNLAMPFALATGSTALYVTIVERGAPTYLSTADLSIRVGILTA